MRHGALIVRGLVPPERVAHLIDDIDRTFVARDAYFDGAPVSETAPWYVPFEPESGTASIGPIRKWVREGGGVLTVESPRSMFDVLDTFEAVGLAEPLAGYLGERPVLAAKKWTLRKVPLDITADWHQDGAFLGEGVRAVNVWLALSHCGDDAPGLDIVGGRLTELAPRGTEGAWFDWSVGDSVVRVGRRRADRAADLRGRRRDPVRRHEPAPHRRDARDDARALRDRVVVLRAVALSRRADPGDVLSVTP